ncbi:hypothetical protein E4U39_000594, partial [Claviceps sp. Clav50 group G5]
MEQTHSIEMGDLPVVVNVVNRSAPLAFVTTPRNILIFILADDNVHSVLVRRQDAVRRYSVDQHIRDHSALR